MHTINPPHTIQAAKNPKRMQPFAFGKSKARSIVLVIAAYILLFSLNNAKYCCVLRHNWAS